MFLAQGCQGPVGVSEASSDAGLFSVHVTENADKRQAHQKLIRSRAQVTDHSFRVVALLVPKPPLGSLELPKHANVLLKI